MADYNIHGVWNEFKVISLYSYAKKFPGQNNEAKLMFIVGDVVHAIKY